VWEVFFEKRVKYVTGIGGKQTRDELTVTRIFSSVFTKSRRKIKFSMRYTHTSTSNEFQFMQPKY
jgi:hypothetical protein